MSQRAQLLLDSLPHPVMMIGPDDSIADVNAAAEAFFGTSLVLMRRHAFKDFLPFGSPILSLIEDVRRTGASRTDRRVDLTTPRTGPDRVADIYAAAITDKPGYVIVMMQEQTIAEKMGRQLTSRSAARSVSALAAMLAHEIKNPLSGIKGAAQLLETALSDDDRLLTQLICDETERIVKLVDRMELFSDARPVEWTAVNIHTVLDHVRRLAMSGFARHVRFVEDYDPSLPPVHGNRDQLIQVFLNLIKNAAEAIGPDAQDAEIVLSTAFRSGVRIATGAGGERIALPLEITVRDNGPGIPEELMPHLFDPFVTTKSQGSGLGLALVAKVIGDHRGTISAESVPRRTSFRVLMPMQSARDGRADHNEENERGS
jgi:two-component system, NtrC family, nitrogen regulation sensor histidine kinase GlnL